MAISLSRGAFAFLLTYFTASGAATLEVDPNKRFARLEAAVPAAAPGDVIRVFPRPDGRAYKSVGVLVDKPRLTIEAAADDGVLAGFELTGASNATDDGAGVRINQANRVTIRS